MKIQKFKEYSLQDSMANDFLNSFDKMIVESEETSYKNIEKKVISDLRLNAKLVLTFGAGIGAFYPIVDKLMKNMNIDSIELTPDRIVLLTIAAVTIIFVEEKKFKSAEEEEILVKDSKSMLEELKMMGIGNGIVEDLVNYLSGGEKVKKVDQPRHRNR